MQHIVIIHGSVGSPDQEHGNDQAKIADTIDQECLLASRCSRWPGVPETNQEIAANPDTFPEHKQQQEITYRDQHCHGKDKES